MVKIAAAQMRVSEDMETNYRRSLEFIKEAAEADAKMVCFPEGQLTHYVPQYKGLKTEDIAIEMDHPYIQGFCDTLHHFLRHRRLLKYTVVFIIIF